MNRGVVALWARVELRRRWRSWTVLGLLVGVVVGVTAAGVAGARRSSVAYDRFHGEFRTDAGVLPNDPAFGPAERAAVAALPEVEASFDFAVFFVEAAGDADFWPGLVPVDAVGLESFGSPLVAGRLPALDDPTEVVVDENARAGLGLDIGDSFELAISEGIEDVGDEYIPPRFDPDWTTQLRVVGITQSPIEGMSWTPSPAFVAAHRDVVPNITNMMVQVRGGQAGVDALSVDVAAIMGRPIDVVDFATSDRKTRDSIDLETNGLLLFALAALVGGGALLLPALVRATGVATDEIRTLRAIGLDDRAARAALVAPALLSAAVAAPTAVAVAVALSPQFPLGVARDFDLGPGVHADWAVLVPAAVAAIVLVLVVAAVTARRLLTTATSAPARPSLAGRLAAGVALPPAALVGVRLGLEPGRGERSVPVRSAVTGAVAGIVGVVGCATFRAGLDDATGRPERAGIVWDAEGSSEVGGFDPGLADVVAGDPDVDAAMAGTWVRALDLAGIGVPTWSFTPVSGTMPLVLMDGRAPASDAEIALTPGAAHQLHAGVGDELPAGDGGTRPVRVVGIALLPATSHTSYDQGAWATPGGVERLLPPEDERGPGDVTSAVFVRVRDGADLDVVVARLGAEGVDLVAPSSPTEILALRKLRVLPLVLAAFLAALAAATLGHALVATVRRRRHDLAVLRALGMSRRQAVGAIATQASVVAAIGLVVGMPVGLVAGRSAYRWLADSFPFVYASPLPTAALLVVVPLTIVAANVLASPPARRAATLRPAEVLRAE